MEIVWPRQTSRLTMSAMDVDSIGGIPVAEKPRSGTVSKLLGQYTAHVGEPKAPASRGSQTKAVSSHAVDSSSQSKGDSRNSRQTSRGESSTGSANERLMAAIELGDYDGGLEAENMVRGEIVHGDGAHSLDLDSSASR